MTRGIRVVVWVVLGIVYLCLAAWCVKSGVRLANEREVVTQTLFVVKEEEDDDPAKV